MKPTVRIESKSVVLPQTDVDTDQIIPARFLTTTTKTGLGTHLFAEWRYAKDGTLREEFVLNQVPVASHAILVAGHNFGCGSSREHAPWALLDYGLRAVISTEIADIFRANSLKNGFLPIVVDIATHKWLVDHPGADLVIDLESTTLRFDDRTVSFPIDRFSRYCLINGIDQLGFLLENADAITEFERRSA
jgi:3-isopropylmalate/(R)-2-methylmalate dehydratase small subunit